MWDVQWWKGHWPELAFPNPNGSRLIALFEYGLVHLRVAGTAHTVEDIGPFLPWIQIVNYHDA